MFIREFPRMRGYYPSEGISSLSEIKTAHSVVSARSISLARFIFSRKRVSRAYLSQRRGDRKSKDRDLSVP